MGMLTTLVMAEPTAQTAMPGMTITRPAPSALMVRMRTSGSDDFSRLVRQCRGEDAFVDALANNLGQQRRTLLMDRVVDSLAHDRVGIRIPDAQCRQNVVFVLDTQAIE